MILILDHTYGTPLGYYMYIETSFPQNSGDKARLISPVYNITAGGSCLEFYYHMWGRSTGALNVFAKTNNAIQSAPLWALSGDQGDLWRPARANILSAGKFQVRVFSSIHNIKCLIYIQHRLSSKVSLVQVTRVIFLLMMLVFLQAHVQLMVHVISSKISALGQLQRRLNILIGIESLPNRYLQSTPVIIIQQKTQPSTISMDIFFGLPLIFVTILSIKHHDYTQKFCSHINLREDVVLLSAISSPVLHQSESISACDPLVIMDLSYGQSMVIKVNNGRNNKLILPRLILILRYDRIYRRTMIKKQ